jgi:hypothetical protein
MALVEFKQRAIYSSSGSSKRINLLAGQANQGLTKSTGFSGVETSLS